MNADFTGAVIKELTTGPFFRTSFNLLCCIWLLLKVATYLTNAIQESGSFARQIKFADVWREHEITICTN